MPPTSLTLTVALLLQPVVCAASSAQTSQRSGLPDKVITIDFDELPVGQVLTNQFAGLGIVIEPISHVGNSNDPEDPLQIPTIQTAQAMQNEHGDGRPSNGNVLVPSPNTGDAAGAFRLRFVHPANPLQERGVQAVSADFIDVDGDTTLIRAFDMDGDTLDLTQPQVLGDGDSQLCGVSVDFAIYGNAITSAEFVLGHHGDAVWIDNLTVVIVGGCVGISPADFDCDDRVSLIDFTTFATCFGGTVSNPTDGCTPLDASHCDITGDGIIGLDDFAIFAQQFTG